LSSSKIFDTVVSAAGTLGVVGKSGPWSRSRAGLPVHFVDPLNTVVVGRYGGMCVTGSSVVDESASAVFCFFPPFGFLVFAPAADPVLVIEVLGSLVKARK
jgi:hypothetical protein